jgi:hypothetical protein
MSIIENTPESIVVRRNWLPWAVAAMLLVALGIVLLIHSREEPPRAAEPVRFQIFPPSNTHFARGLSLSPNRRWLTFDAVGANGRTALWLRAFDSVESRPLPGTEGVLRVSFWSPDSRFLAFHVQNKLKKDRDCGRGRWIAYRSDKSGRPEIYVRPFSDSAGGVTEWTISNGGGTEPRWRRDGKELFYFTGEGTLVAVEVSTSGGMFKAGIAKPLFDTRIVAGDTPVLFDTLVITGTPRRTGSGF